MKIELDKNEICFIKNVLIQIEEDNKDDMDNDNVLKNYLEKESHIHYDKFINLIKRFKQFNK